LRQAVDREAGMAGGRQDRDAGTIEKQAGSRQGGRQLRARRQAVYREAGTMERQAGHPSTERQAVVAKKYRGYKEACSR
jgi:hypothetical protein